MLIFFLLLRCWVILCAHPDFVTYIVDQQTTPALIDRCAHRRPPPPSPCVRIFRIICSLAFAVRTALYYPSPLASHRFSSARRTLPLTFLIINFIICIICTSTFPISHLPSSIPHARQCPSRPCLFFLFCLVTLHSHRPIVPFESLLPSSPFPVLFCSELSCHPRIVIRDT